MNEKKWYRFKLKDFGGIYENKDRESKQSFKMMVEQYGFPEHVLDRLLAKSEGSKWLERILEKPKGLEILKSFICEPSIDLFNKCIYWKEIEFYYHLLKIVSLDKV